LSHWLAALAVTVALASPALGDVSGTQSDGIKPRPVDIKLTVTPAGDLIVFEHGSSHLGFLSIYVTTSKELHPLYRKILEGSRKTLETQASPVSIQIPFGMAQDMDGASYVVHVCAVYDTGQYCGEVAAKAGEAVAGVTDSWSAKDKRNSAAREIWKHGARVANTIPSSPSPNVFVHAETGNGLGKLERSSSSASPENAKAAESAGGPLAQFASGEMTPSFGSGRYQTTFGAMSLDGRTGSYDYSGGNIKVTAVNGDEIDGIWEQTKSSHQCSDGRFYGHFHFTFSAAGFSGRFGYCDDAPSEANVWNGSRS